MQSQVNPPIHITLFSIFSEKGIRKLQVFKHELGDFLKKSFKPGEVSEHSVLMVQHIIKIIDILTEHNDIGFWKKETNILELTKLVDFVDNETGTQVPEVFNEQTYQLGQKILDILKQIKFDEELNKPARLALETISGKPERLIATMQRNVERKLQLYDMFQRSKKEKEKMQATQSSIKHELDALEERAKTLTPTNYIEFQADYEIVCRTLLIDIDALVDYTRMGNADAFINTSKPYKLIPELMITVGNRSDCIKEIIQRETGINQLLQQKKMAKVMIAHDHHVAFFSEEHLRALDQAFKELKKEFFEMLDLYLSGAHLYQSGNMLVGIIKKIHGIDGDKKGCVEGLKKWIEGIVADLKPDYSIRAKSFDIFKLIYTAIGKNEEIAKRKDISLGEISKIFNLFTLRFLSFSIEVNHTNDSSLDLHLRNCEKALGIERHPVIALPDPNTQRM